MSTEEALELVYELAIDNALEPDDIDSQKDPELFAVAKQQQEALAIVHDFLLNHVFR